VALESRDEISRCVTHADFFFFFFNRRCGGTNENSKEFTRKLERTKLVSNSFENRALVYIQPKLNYYTTLRGRIIVGSKLYF
jgi:hypothetical protein